MKLAGTAAFLCVAAVAHAQENQKRSIPFIAEIGDAATVTINHRRIEKSDYSSKTTDVRLVYRSEIVNETADGYKLTWRPRSMTVLGQTIDTTKDRPEIEQDIDLEFETDGAGAPVRLMNHEAVRENALKTVEVQSIRYAESTTKGVRAMFANLNAESAVGVFGKYALLVGFFQGFSIEIAKPLSYSDEIPNPFGGGAISAQATVTLVAVDEAKDVATFEWRQTADPASAKSVVAAIMKDAAKSTGKPVDMAEIDRAKFDFSYKATANVGLSDGWLRTLVYESNAIVLDREGEKGRTESYHISVERKSSP